VASVFLPVPDKTLGALRLISVAPNGSLEITRTALKIIHGHDRFVSRTLSLSGGKITDVDAIGFKGAGVATVKVMIKDTDHMAKKYNACYATMKPLGVVRFKMAAGPQ